MEHDTDSRQEVDEQLTPLNGPRLVIRTLPKGCNPVPQLERPPSRSGLSIPNVEDDDPFDDITEEKLLTVDTRKQSIEALGELLPSLTQLNLHQSVLRSFRDLGTSLHGLQVLYLMRSGIKDLDGIGALTGLRELYLQFNEISDVSSLSMHEELQILDLQGNLIDDITQIEQLGRSYSVLVVDRLLLGLCPQLETLSLDENHVANIPQYRAIVCNYIPQLRKLDGADVTQHDKLEVTSDMIDKALGYKISNSLQHDESISKIPPLSPSKPSFELLLDAAKEIDQHSSELTHGTDVVFAGNVTSALRRRSHEYHDELISPIARPATPVHNLRPTTPVNRESITDTLDRASQLDLSSRLSSKSRDSILHELKMWKMESSVAHMTSTPSRSRPNTASSQSRGNSKDSNAESPPKARNQNGLSKPHPVEILVLDESPDDESPAQKQWNLNLEGLTSRIGIQPTSRHCIPRNDEDDDKDSSSDSDTEVRPKKSRIGLFNVGDSLNAIEEWTARITNSEEEDNPVVVVPIQDRCRTPKAKKTPSKSTIRGPEFPTHAHPKGPELPNNVRSKGPELPLKMPTQGPSLTCKPVKVHDLSASSNHIEYSYNALSDETLVMVLQGKDKRFSSHVKTKEGFRTFFNGISETRFELLLRRAYGHGDKMQRRLQLMEGRMTQV
ncbi:Leucine-rich repeat-containing protein 56 [Aphanomyces cochlioides]|nr:Leucine-rich repeat-containing protein 56 [Aphanomyces cochlioides]